jgi:hypothetical protein
MSKLLTFLPLIILAIGLIGWTLTLRADVTSTTDKIALLQQEIVTTQKGLDSERNVRIESHIDQSKDLVASHAGFRDLARQALSPRTGIPAKTDWEVFLHGFASTNQRGGEKEREIYECLLRTFPTPESVLEQDLRTLRNKEGCQNLQSPVPAADWIKKSAANWDNIAPLLRCRTRAEQDAIRNFIKDPQNQNKRLVKQFTGAGYKGADMTLLWGGCEVPVIDKQLIRYLAPH